MIGLISALQSVANNQATSLLFFKTAKDFRYNLTILTIDVDLLSSRSIPFIFLSDALVEEELHVSHFLLRSYFPEALSASA